MTEARSDSMLPLTHSWASNTLPGEEAAGTPPHNSYDNRNGSGSARKIYIACVRIGQGGVCSFLDKTGATITNDVALAIEWTFEDDLGKLIIAKCEHAHSQACRRVFADEMMSKGAIPLARDFT